MLLLALIIAGICLMFGFLKPDSFYKLLLWLIVGPLLLSLACSELLIFYSGLPQLGQIGFLLLLSFLCLFAIRQLFPNSNFVRSMCDFLWSLLVFLLTFPIRLLWRAGKQIADREQTRIRLQRYRPTVGGRPPLINSPGRNLTIRRD